MKNITLFKPAIKIIALSLIIAHFKVNFLELIFLFDYYKLFYLPSSLSGDIHGIPDVWRIVRIVFSLTILDYYTMVEEASTLEWIDKKTHLHKFWVTCNDFNVVNTHMNFAYCSGLALVDSQTLTQLLAHSHSAVGQGEKMGWKLTSWDKDSKISYQLLS